MFLVLLTMILILMLAGLVIAYMVFPRRGLEVPRAPWAGPLLDRSIRALPTLHNTVGGPLDTPPLQSQAAGRRRLR